MGIPGSCLFEHGSGQIVCHPPIYGRIRVAHPAEKQGTRGGQSSCWSAQSLCAVPVYSPSIGRSARDPPGQLSCSCLFCLLLWEKKLLGTVTSAVSSCARMESLLPSLLLKVNISSPSTTVFIWAFPWPLLFTGQNLGYGTHQSTTHGLCVTHRVCVTHLRLLQTNQTRGWQASVAAIFRQGGNWSRSSGN